MLLNIINEGRMKCIGSPLFLIEKFGKFMSLNISKEENADNEKIVEFIKNNKNNIEYEILSEEIMFRIPVKDDKENGKINKWEIAEEFVQIVYQNFVVI